MTPADIFPPTIPYSASLSSDGNFGVRNGRFGFNLTGPTNIPVAIQTSTNARSNWTTISNVTLTTGSFYFSDPLATNGAARFYRLSPPQ